MILPESKIEALMNDNKSSEAMNRNQRWSAISDAKELYAIWACCDSRLVLPMYAVHILSIATGGSRSPFGTFLSDQRIKAITIVNHHDGSEAVSGRSPGGCGGRDAKKGFNEKDAVNPEGIGGFVSNHIWDWDLVGQSYAAGAFTAYRSEKPTLATTQDHLSLKIYPLALFLNGGRSVEAQVPHHFLSAKQYFPGKIYENGIPVLDQEKVPDTFDAFFAENRLQASQINKSITNLRETQKTQNPHLLVVSKDIPRPFSVRYPETSSIPGSVFIVSAPLQTIDDISTLSKRQFADCLGQIQYPISHFNNLGTILFESRNIEESAKAASILANQSWMENWLLEPGHQILISQVRKGVTELIGKIS